MKKLIVITILLIIPYKVFAVSASDIFSQQNISGTYVESGYADIKLNKNAKNAVMDILYHQIINYIFDNMDSETAKYVSIYMPANLQECDDEYLSYIEQEISLNYSSDVLSICRELAKMGSHFCESVSVYFAARWQGSVFQPWFFGAWHGRRTQGV